MAADVYNYRFFKVHHSDRLQCAMIEERFQETKTILFQIGNRYYACSKVPHHFGKKKHALAFVAICVTVQYKMDNGLPIWDV